MKIKINIFDISAIVLLILLAFVAYFKFNVIDHTKADVQLDKIEYTMEFQSLRKYSVDTFQSGDTVYDSQTKIVIGKITDINVNPAKRVVETSKGEAVVTINPERYDVLVTIVTDGMETDKAYFADRSVELKVGSYKTIETLYIKSTGEIKSIKVK